MSLDRSTPLPGLLLAGVGVLMAGCATTGGERYAAAPFLAPGSTVSVDQPIDMRGNARVYIQHGQISRWADLEHFQPYCSFGLRKQAGDTGLRRTIRPGTFTTGEPRPRVRVVSRGRARALRVAGLRLAKGEVPGAGVGRLTFTVVIPLQSAQQPQVHDVTCGFDRKASWYGNPPHPTLDGIRTALGELASVQPAGGD